jgi:hypothetical protein
MSKTNTLTPHEKEINEKEINDIILRGIDAGYERWKESHRGDTDDSDNEDEKENKKEEKMSEEEMEMIREYSRKMEEEKKKMEIREEKRKERIRERDKPHKIDMLRKCLSLKDENDSLLGDSTLNEFSLYETEDFYSKAIGYISYLRERIKKRHYSRVMPIIYRRKFIYHDDINIAICMANINSRIIYIPNIDITLIFNIFETEVEKLEAKSKTCNNLTKEEFDKFIVDLLDVPNLKEAYMLINTNDIQDLSFKFINATYSNIKQIEKHITKTMNINPKDIFFMFDLSKKEYDPDSVEELKDDLEEHLDEKNDYNIIIKSISNDYWTNQNKISKLSIEIMKTNSNMREIKTCEIKCINPRNFGREQYFPALMGQLCLEKSRDGYVEKSIKRVKTVANKFQDAPKEEIKENPIEKWIDENIPKTNESKMAYLGRLNTFLGKDGAIDSRKMKEIMERKGYEEKRYSNKKEQKNYYCWNKK